MKNLNRRKFLKGATVATATAFLPRFAIGKSGPSANSKLNVAFIGAGGRTRNLMSGLTSENFVAFCDVDDQRAAATYGEHPKVAHFKDFRRLFDKMGKEIDAVCIATPDHTHFVGTYTAMAHGKHVLTEKPLTHNIWQARTLQKAAHYFKVVTQMGNQGHATEGIRYVKEWYESGAIGKIKEVIALNGGPNFGPTRLFNKPSRFPPTSQAVPLRLNWDLWKGPTADDVKYNEVYLPATWRGFYTFGNGQLGDWACHTLDAPFWSLDLDSPTVIEAIHKEERTLEGMVPTSSAIRFEAPIRGKKSTVALTWYERDWPEVDPSLESEDWGDTRMLMIGKKGSIATGARPNSPRLYPETKWQDFRRDLPEKTIPRIKGSHISEWVQAIKGDGPEPGSNFDYASRLTEFTLLGVLAQRFNRRIEWDSKKMEITNDPELNQYVREPVRRGWEMGDEVW